MRRAGFNIVQVSMEYGWRDHNGRIEKRKNEAQTGTNEAYLKEAASKVSNLVVSGTQKDERLFEFSYVFGWGE